MPSTSAETSRTRRFSTDRERWQAICQRDANADGRFVFAVVSTGIYCRPSCPARRPLRENVRFFGSHSQAEKSGFRACKRCRPNGSPQPDRHSRLVAKACAMIDASEETVDLKSLASEAKLSSSHFQRVFKSMVGLSPKQYAQGQRMMRLKRVLPNEASITKAIYRAGFRSSSRFYESSAHLLGMTPKSARSRGSGVMIHYGFGISKIGHVLVAATEIGVCWISLGSSRANMRQELKAHYASATFQKGGEQFDALLKDVIGVVEGTSSPLRLPLDLQGTVFQRRVWLALQQIPPGELCSYQELAARVGRPRAVRAVASACAANKLAVAIPCHRVVRSDGSPSGYRWGAQRKQQLQKQEQLAAKQQVCR